MSFPSSPLLLISLSFKYLHKTPLLSEICEAIHPFSWCKSARSVCLCLLIPAECVALHVKPCLSDWPLLYGLPVPDLAPVHTKYMASKTFHFSCHISHPPFHITVKFKLFILTLNALCNSSTVYINSCFFLLSNSLLSSTAMSSLIPKKPSVFSCNKCSELPLKIYF